MSENDDVYDMLCGMVYGRARAVLGRPDEVAEEVGRMLRVGMRRVLGDVDAAMARAHEQLGAVDLDAAVADVLEALDRAKTGV